MCHVRSLENNGFRGKFVKVRRVHLDASITRNRVRSLLVPIPEPVLRAMGRIGDVFSFFPLNSESVDRLAGELVVDTSAMRGILGGVYPFSMTEGLARTADWYRRRR